MHELQSNRRNHKGQSQAAKPKVRHLPRVEAIYLQTGAGLCILSDPLVALRLFVAAGVNLAQKLLLALWPAYWCGQALILIGAGLYWLPFGDNAAAALFPTR